MPHSEHATTRGGAVADGRRMGSGEPTSGETVLPLAKLDRVEGTVSELLLGDILLSLSADNDGDRLTRRTAARFAGLPASNMPPPFEAPLAVLEENMGAETSSRLGLGEMVSSARPPPSFSASL